MLIILKVTNTNMSEADLPPPEYTYASPDEVDTLVAHAYDVLHEPFGDLPITDARLDMAFSQSDLRDIPELSGCKAVDVKFRHDYASSLFQADVLFTTEFTPERSADSPATPIVMSKAFGLHLSPGHQEGEPLVQVQDLMVVSGAEEEAVEFVKSIADHYDDPKERRTRLLGLSAFAAEMRSTMAHERELEAAFDMHQDQLTVEQWNALMATFTLIQAKMAGSKKA